MKHLCFMTGSFLCDPVLTLNCLLCNQRSSLLQKLWDFKTFLDICTLYTVYKNVLNPLRIATAVLEHTPRKF